MSSGHSREDGNPVKLGRLLDSGSPLRCGRSKIPDGFSGE